MSLVQIDAESCDYLVDLDFPQQPVSSTLEPRYAMDSSTWERVYCERFLDAKNSLMLSRILWFPGNAWQSTNQFGDYCLLKNKALVGSKELLVSQRVKQQ